MVQGFDTGFVEIFMGAMGNPLAHLNRIYETLDLNPPPHFSYPLCIEVWPNTTRDETTWGDMCRERQKSALPTTPWSLQLRDGSIPRSPPSQRARGKSRI